MRTKSDAILLLLVIISFFFLVIASRNKDIAIHTSKTDLWKEMKENSCNIVIDSIKTPFVFVSFEDSIAKTKMQITFGVDIHTKELSE